MSSFRLFFIFAAIVIAITSCEYSPTGSNYQNINPNFNPPVMNIELPEDGKTIMIQNNVVYYLNYKLKGDLSKFYKVLFYLDTNMIYESTTIRGEVYLEKKIKNLTQEYTLRMVVLNHSGTSSMADRLNMEGSYAEKRWKVVVYNPSLFKSDSVSYTIEDGVLKLYWKKYPFDNFVRYEIKKIIKENKSNKSEFIYTIINKDSNWFFDKSYIGERADYQIKIYHKENSYNYYFLFPEINLDSDLPVFISKKIDNTSIEISWTKNKFYHSISHFSLKDPKIPFDSIVQSMNQSKIIKDLPLGTSDIITVTIVPNELHGDPKVWFNLPFSTGDPSFNYTEFETRNGDIIYYVEKISDSGYYFKLVKYSISKNTILNSINFSTPTSKENRLSISPSGKNIVFRSGNNLVCCLNGDLSNPKVLTDLKITGKVSNYGFDCQAISDNGIVAAGLNGAYIYDIVNDKLICSMPTDTPSEISISSNGDFVALTNSGTNESKVYKIESSSANVITQSFRGFNFQFDNNNNSKVYYFLVGSIMRYFDCNTLIHTNIDNSNFLNYLDLESGLATRNFGNELYEILDLNNGLKQIFTYKSKNGSGYIKGDYIYFTTGLKCKFR